MSPEEFQSEVINRLTNLETDLSFIKGVIEGKKERTSTSLNKISIGLSAIALIVSAILLYARISMT